MYSSLFLHLAIFILILCSSVLFCITPPLNTSDDCVVPLLLSTLLHRTIFQFTSLYYTLDKTLLVKIAQPALFVFGGGIFVSVVIYCIFGEKYDGCHVESSSFMSMHWIWRSKFNTLTQCFKIVIAATPVPSEETTGVCSSMCYCVVLTNPAPYLGALRKVELAYPLSALLSYHTCCIVH